MSVHAELDPAARHAAALASLDRRISLAREHIQDARTVAIEDGRRRIMERHSPRECSNLCRGPHWVCLAHPAHNWPCPDWADAAAEPEEDEDA